MSIFEKHRFKIFTSVQHPYKHTLDDFAYSNPGMGNTISTVQGAIDYLFAVLYPQEQPAVADQASLPLIGNTLNDFRVVNDDGDGKAAAYRWELREGEASASWHKIYDYDWGVDSILQQSMLKTNDLYVSKKGYDERDSAGVVIAGIMAGAFVYGGASPNSNFTMFANSGDGLGPSTGYIQFGDNSRPIVDNAFDFGTTALRFKKLWAYSAALGTATISSGSYVDTSGTIDFGATNLTTTGTLTAGGIVLATATFGTLTVASGSITDTSGTITFADENLNTTGTVDTGVLTVTHNAQTIVLDPDLAGEANILCSHALLNFNAVNLATTGTVAGGNATFTQVNADNLRLDGNTFSSTNANGNIIVSANGTGLVDVQSAMTTIGQTVTGVLAVTGQVNADNLRLDANVLSSTNLNGNITLTPNGSGRAEFSSSIFPTNTGTQDIGDSTHVWNDLWVTGSLGDANPVAVSVLESLRDINVAVGVNYTIFWDGTKWISSAPDSEIVHGNLSGLGADDHLQYLLLAGRAGSQDAVGGTAAGENLSFDSTAHATKGRILFKSNLAPSTNASFAGTWSGTDIGDSTHYFRDVYTRGEFFNFRLENLSADFVSSAANRGRLGFNYTTGLVIYDTGAAVISVGAQHSETDTIWNGTDVTKTVTISGVNDARKAIWALHDNTNDFEQVFAKITKTNATTVVIDVTPALPAGTYRLIGLA